MNSLKLQRPEQAGDLRESRRSKPARAEQLRLVLHKNGVRLDGPVVDMSYSGCALLLPQTEISPVREFESFDLSFILGSQELARTRGIVRYLRATKVDGEAFLRVGLEMDPMLPRPGSEERRKKTRFALKEFFQPFAVAKHPLFPEENVLFRVLEFSENGLALITSARNSNLLLGMPLELSLQNPFGGAITAAGTVQNVKPVEGNRLRVGVELVQDSSALLEEFNALLLAGSTAVSLKTLKAAGSPTQKTARGAEAILNACDFSRDGSRILELRARCAGKDASPQAAETSADSQRDEQDAAATHFLMEKDEACVASARFVAGNDAGDGEAASRGASIPSWLSKKGYVECSRMAFHPDFRSAEFIASFLAQAGRLAAAAGHRYVLACCGVAPARLAARAGYEEIGSFDDPKGTGEQRVLVLDVQALRLPKR